MVRSVNLRNSVFDYLLQRLAANTTLTMKMQMSVQFSADAVCTGRYTELYA